MKTRKLYYMVLICALMFVISACGKSVNKLPGATYVNDSKVMTLRGANPAMPCYLFSYNLYEELDEEQLEQVADYWWKHLTDEDYNDGFFDEKNTRPDISKLSLVFYVGDTDEEYCKFMYDRNGRREAGNNEGYLNANYTEIFDAWLVRD